MSHIGGKNCAFFVTLASAFPYIMSDLFLDGFSTIKFCIYLFNGVAIQEFSLEEVLLIRFDSNNEAGVYEVDLQGLLL